MITSTVPEGAHRCTCGVKAADRGDLETHVLDFQEGHQPVDADDWTDLVRSHVELNRRKKETRSKLAETAGVSLADLREALR